MPSSLRKLKTTIIMKNLLFAFMLLAIQSNAQCWKGSPRKASVGPKITASLIIDKSMKYYPSGFSGFGVHTGVWIDWLGFTVGGVESKINDKSEARRDLVFTMYGRYNFIDDKLQISPYFSVGSNNYQDIGIRAGWYILNSAYVGAFIGRTQHYGISIMVSLENK
jgi:hypothetical protein